MFFPVVVLTVAVADVASQHVVLVVVLSVAVVVEAILLYGGQDG